MLGILLAAGRGTRMKSEKPKVLFDINDEPLCFAPFKAAFECCDKLVVVVGYKAADVKAALEEHALQVFGEEAFRTKVQFCTQDPPQGTGDAVKVALNAAGKNVSHHDEVIVVNGDLPLIRSSTLNRFIKNARTQHLSSACLSQLVKNPFGLGRILRDSRGVFSAIREEKDANAEEKRIREINGGVYYFKSSLLLEAIQSLNSSNSQKEFYLTDLLGNSRGPSIRSEALPLRNSFDLWGVNTTFELSQARFVAQNRLQKQIAEDFGVDFLNPSTTLIGARVKFRGEARIGPNVVLSGQCTIGSGTVIEGSCKLHNVQIGEGATISWGSVLDDSVVGDFSQVGPMARLRPGSSLGKNVKVGNFVELKKTRMGDGSKASHLAYLGDADIGDEANIGCGTITCNYDGFNKYKTIIGKKAFIGSDTQLIAPVEVGEGAYVGSGTTVTQDVPAGALALSRPELVLKPGYAQKMSMRGKKA